MKAALVILGIIFIAASGFFSFVFGVVLSHKFNIGDVVFFGTGLALSAAVSGLFLRKLLGASFHGITPLAMFLLACAACGVFYSFLKIPEGYKLIAIGLIMSASGVLFAKKTVRKPDLPARVGGTESAAEQEM